MKIIPLIVTLPLLSPSTEINLDSRWQLSAITQLVECLTVNQVVTGSNPVGGVTPHGCKNSLRTLNVRTYKLF